MQRLSEQRLSMQTPGKHRMRAQTPIIIHALHTASRLGAGRVFGLAGSARARLASAGLADLDHARLLLCTGPARDRARPRLPLNYTVDVGRRGHCCGAQKEEKEWQ